MVKEDRPGSFPTFPASAFLKRCRTRLSRPPSRTKATWNVNNCLTLEDNGFAGVSGRADRGFVLLCLLSATYTESSPIPFAGRVPGLVGVWDVPRSCRPNAVVASPQKRRTTSVWSPLQLLFLQTVVPARRNRLPVLVFDTHVLLFRVAYQLHPYEGQCRVLIENGTVSLQ